MLLAVALLLVLIWGLEVLAFHVGGRLIHGLLVIALIIFFARLIKGRRRP